MKKGPGALLRPLQVCKIPKRAGQGHQRSHSRGEIKKKKRKNKRKREEEENKMRQSERAEAARL